MYLDKSCSPTLNMGSERGGEGMANDAAPSAVRTEGGGGNGGVGRGVKASQ